MTMAEHTVKAFDQELQEITRRIAEMGRVIEKQIAGAVDAMTSHDVDERPRGNVSAAAGG